MRIVLTNHGIFPISHGGMERHTYNLARYLHRSKVDVTVLVPESPSQAEFPFPVHFLPWPRRPVWLWSNWEFSREVATWIRQHPVDLAFGQGFNLWAYLRTKEHPCIFHPHGLEMFATSMRFWERKETMPFRSLVRFHAKYSNVTISLGGQLTGILLNQARVESDRLVEIPNAVDPDEFPESRGDRVADSFLFVSRLAFNKGIDLLARAVSKVKTPSFRLTIVGDGPLRREVEDLVQRDSRVTYVPTPSQNTLRDLYAKHECLLFTSRFEGMPTVILEAMATGCAVVATKIGAVELLVGKENGILVDPTEDGILQGMEMFLQSDKLQRRELGRGGRKKVVEQFSWQQVIQKYIELFERLVR